jgi:hypothetical protein
MPGTANAFSSEARTEKPSMHGIPITWPFDPRKFLNEENSPLDRCESFSSESLTLRQIRVPDGGGGGLGEDEGGAPDDEEDEDEGGASSSALRLRVEKTGLQLWLPALDDEEDEDEGGAPSSALRFAPDDEEEDDEP